MKLAIATQEKKRAEIGSTHLEIHKSLSYIAREFSLTSLCIMLDARTSKLEYDRKYLESCERMDSARALIEMHFPDAGELINKLHGQMNIFWGNFTEVSALLTSNDQSGRRHIFQEKANLAALEIEELVFKAKYKLNNIARELTK